MNHNENAFVIYLKVQSLVTSIKNYFNLSYRESLKLLYYSKLYKALENEEAKMWYYSSYDLFKMFLEEKETGDYICMEVKHG